MGFKPTALHTHVHVYVHVYMYMYVVDVIHVYTCTCTMYMHMYVYNVYTCTCTCRLISIGVEFCGEGSSSLQESMRQQSLNYFKNYHRSAGEEITVCLTYMLARLTCSCTALLS